MHNRTKRTGKNYLDFFCVLKKHLLKIPIWRGYTRMWCSWLERCTLFRRCASQYRVITVLCKKQLRKSMFPSCKENTRQGERGKIVLFFKCTIIIWKYLTEFLGFAYNGGCILKKTSKFPRRLVSLNCVSVVFFVLRSVFGNFRVDFFSLF